VNRLRTAVLVLALLPAAVVSATRAGEKPLNPKCPVLTDEDSDPAIFAEYQGKKVFFCCHKCQRKFLADPGKYVANLPQFAAPPVSAPEKLGALATTAAEKAPPAPKPEPVPSPAVAPSSRTKLVSFLGRFHPAIVHFPIALILAAGLAELLFLLTGRPVFASATRFIMPLAALGAVAAALLGWAAAAGAHYPPDLARVLEWHRGFGAIVVVSSVAAAILREQVEQRPAAAGLRWSYRGILLLAVLLVSAAGYFGGELVYGTDYYAWPS
jgi:uncharacterized membrane protein/YHS domain-containing protein